MDSAPRRTRGRILACLTLAAVVTGTLSAVSLTAEANPFCLVQNLTTGAQGTDLQQAINDANNGDTITVTGVCFGNFVVGNKTLTLRGISVSTRRYPTLDGNNSGPVLFVVSDAVVTVKDLLITHGLTGLGGGIDIVIATVILNGSTRVVHNSATFGGGIYDDGGVVTMNGSTRVNLNQASSDGGGIYLNVGGTLTMNKNSRVNMNQAADVGGGILNDFSTLTMNGGSTVIGNIAANDGGGIYNCCGSDSGATAGGNVRNNTPNDIAP